jgi:uncharacterized membrane protein YjjP (DUF1212 family)
MGVLLATVLRLLVPLSILRWNLGGTLASMLLDGFDTYLPDFPSLAEFGQYQRWDKSLDLYYLSLAFAVSLLWKNSWAKKSAIILYVLRALGTILFLVTASRSWLFFFPNFFEYFFLFQLGFLFLFKKNIFDQKRVTFPVLAILFILKLIQEYILHYAQIEFWRWF